jgi:hypothetical protein
VGLIVREEIAKSVMMCEPVSDKIMIMRFKMTLVNLLLVQINAPCESEKEEEKERFYEKLDQVIGEFRKGKRVPISDGRFQWKSW